MLLRNAFLLAWGFILAGTALASAQGWAERMFAVSEHDFGTLTANEQSEYAFEFINPYHDEVHIVAVHTSCGCAVPRVTQERLATGESAQVITRFNTRSFRGPHAATITVVFDKPFRAEVQLQVEGNVVGDVVIEPPTVDLGQVRQGTAAEASVRVIHTGAADWEIRQAHSENPHLEMVLTETERTPEVVSYELLVRLGAEAPAGYLNEQVLLVTSDETADPIPVLVEGRVVEEPTVSPALLSLGEIASGEQMTQQVVVRASRLFRIVAIRSSDERLAFSFDGESREMHLVSVTFTAGEEEVPFRATCQVETDLGGQTAVCVVTGVVRAEEAGNVSESSTE